MRFQHFLEAGKKGLLLVAGIIFVGVLATCDLVPPNGGLDQSGSPTVNSSPTPAPNQTPAPSSTPTPTPTPSLSPTPTPSSTPTPSPTPTPSSSPTPTPSPPSTAKAIIAFNFSNPVATGVVTEASHTIAVSVPYGTNLTALSPSITISGVNISPSSGIANNFSNPATYTVTAADASTQSYTVTVTVIPPDIWVSRVGDGTSSLSSSASALAIQVFPMVVSSTSTSTYAVSGLTIAGSSTTEGILNQSLDGKFITFTGYGAATGTASIASTTSAAAPRKIGRIDSSGLIDTTTSLSGYSGTSIRSAVTDDGSRFWTSGGNDGIYYVPFGAVNSGQLVSSTPTNTRVVSIFQNQLYMSTGSGTAGIYTIGSGLPTNAGAAANQVISISNPNQFAMVDYDGDGTPDLAYVAVDATPTSGGLNIQKFSFNGSTWSATALSPSISTSVGARSLAALKTASGVTVVAVTSTGSLVFFDDDLTGNSLSVQTIASPTSNYMFRGVAFAPH